MASRSLLAAAPPSWASAAASYLTHATTLIPAASLGTQAGLAGTNAWAPSSMHAGASVQSWWGAAAASQSHGVSTSAAAQASSHKFGRANPAFRKKHFNLWPAQQQKGAGAQPQAQQTRGRGWEYQWVVVGGGQRMLARAAAGTKRWHLWAAAGDVDAKALRQRRTGGQGGAGGTWLVDVGGAPLK
ncbi:hypothetical protein FOA52_011401 [Chlamydomonas sp. UWO 241]|nr:hypothetical protein FOA52_011401 [Chlamydomonas sp. UWO 241]